MKRLRLPPLFNRSILRSVRIRFLALIVFMALAGILATVIVAVTSARSTGAYALETSSQMLRTQAESMMGELTIRSARENDLLLASINQNVQEAGAFVSQSLTSAGMDNNLQLWPARERVVLGAEGQYSNGPDDPGSVFLPNTAATGAAATGALSDQILAEMQSTAALDLLFPAIIANNASVEAAYFATPSDIVRYYPNVNLGAVLPPDFRATQRPWYTGGVENSQGDKVWWTPAYQDATGLGVVTTAALPVYTPEGKLLGVVGFDVTLTEMKHNIEQTRLFSSGYSFLVDDQGRALALPEQGYQDLLGLSAPEQDFGSDLTQARPEFQPVLAEMLGSQTGFKSITIDGEELFFAYSPLPSTRWSLGSVVRANDVLASVYSLQASLEANTREAIVLRILPLSAIVLLLTIAASLVLTNRTVRPMQELAGVAVKLGAGDWQTHIPGYSQDEIGALANALRTMRDHLYQTFQGLEERVLERTRALERHANQIQAAAEVGHSAATLLDLDTLLTRVTHLVSDRFGFYHTGIFLLSNDKEYAVLRAANSAGGQRMLERQHRLRIGQEGIVGKVASSGTPHIALDVGEDAIYFNNPDLPETRSEMALPLRVGETILGALDVQSREANAFHQEDIEVLQLVADQVAVAIQNARLFAQNQETLQTVQRAYGQLSTQAWQDVLAQRSDLGFIATSDGRVLPAHSEWKADAAQAASQGKMVQADAHSIALPVRIRDQVYGSVRLSKPEDSQGWTEREIQLMNTLAEQLGVALESARLYEETQRRAERERLAGEITARMRASNDPAVILQTAVTELRRALNARHVQVLVGSQETGAGAQEPGSNGHARQSMPAQPTPHLDDHKPETEV